MLTRNKEFVKKKRARGTITKIHGENYARKNGQIDERS
jgi:hypothetical protein